MKKVTHRKNMFSLILLAVAFMTPFSPTTVLAQVEGGAAGDIVFEEINSFVAAVVAIPQGSGEWISCTFWFVVTLAVGYMIGALVVIILSDNNVPKRSIYLRQVAIFLIESVLVMLFSTYFGLLCLTTPFALTALGLAVFGIWYYLKTFEKRDTSEEDLDV